MTGISTLNSRPRSAGGMGASGFALRFARITRIRDDKGPEDVDTYARLKDLYAKQFERKGKTPSER